MNRASDNYFAEVLNKRVAVAVGMAGTMANLMSASIVSMLIK